MPTYVYKFVKTGETIEVEQSFADAALTQAVNPRTGRKMAVRKVFTPVGVTFRGDGFYKTDSRSSAKSKSSSATGDSGSSDGSASTSSEPAKGDSVSSPKEASPKDSATKPAPKESSAAKSTSSAKSSSD